jgi:DNA polymerase I
VRPEEKNVRLIMVEKDGRIIPGETRLTYRGYIMPLNYDPEEVASDLSSVDGVEDAWVEEWLLPPYYRSTADIVVYETRSPGILRRINRITVEKSIGRIVNDYPDPLVEALWRRGLRPCTCLGGGCDHSSLRIVEIEVSGDNTIVSMGGLEGWRRRVKADLHVLPRILSAETFHIGLIDAWSRLIVEERLPGLLETLAPVWLDPDEMLTSIIGLIEWCRLSWTPLRMLRSSSIGSVLTSMEALEARKRRYLVVRGYGRLEPPRGLRDLALYDRGGTIYTPRYGTYWGVCQIDYSSLYPSLIAKYNVSGETVDDPYCRSYTVPPGTGHNVCVERRGIVPSIMEKLIPLKEELREAAEKGNSVAEERMRAVKWLLVASFGYLGYRNSLFGSIMAHEVVTGLDRYVMEETRRIAEGMGYEVIHVIVDSIFATRKDRERPGCERLNRVISGRIGLKSRVEEEYVWLTIPVSSRGFGYSNRYFGKTVSGRLVTKGIYMVRRDTPRLIARAQEEALEKLLEADTPEEYQAKITELREIYEKYASIIKSGNAPLEELIINKRIHKMRRAKNNFTRKLVLQAGAPKPKIGYIMAPGRKPVVWNGETISYDKNYYLELLRKAFAEIGYHA